ncbi:serine protease [Methylobacterium radiodurans]|uniref:Serine protease n=1 Tax=Methylobacterium radiodurans TaxID=2202828 RepID=A0A2U8VNZ6_9HYPH|nr:serine protease [Methylobacterium radiodurans]AWN35327.1 serine protease [Methylobacterium radiodurans]
MPRIRLRAAALAATLALPVGATAQPAQRPPAAAPDPAVEAMRAAFEALPESERKALQDALVWTGDYNSVVSGAFGRRTFEGLNAYRTRTGEARDPLDPGVRRAILAAGEAARRAARFGVRTDPASGVTIGVPEHLLSKRTALPGPLPAGTRWQSADGRVTLETRAFPPEAASLDTLFERATAPTPDRRVTYKLKRPDFIVVTGETATGRSYIRYAAGPAGVRGFTLGYDSRLASEVDRLVIAVANSFVPFPDAPAETPGGSAPQSAIKAPTPAQPALPATALPSALPALPRAGAAPAATGLVVAPGRVLTAASALAGCVPRVGAAAARVLASDPAQGLALIEAAGLPAPVLPAPRGTPAGADEALTVVAASAEGSIVAPGTAQGAGLVAPLQPGAAGAPVLDRAGALAGIVARYPGAPRLVAGVAPPASYPVLPGAAVADFLRRNGIPAALGGPAGSSAGAVAPAVVAVTCAR